MVTRYSTAKDIKDTLARFIDRSLISVRKPAGKRPKITIKGAAGGWQAWQHKAELERLGFVITAYGQMDAQDQPLVLTSVGIAMRSTWVDMQ